MNRRHFLTGGLAAGAAGLSGLAAPAGEDPPHFYELRTYSLRNDLEPSRIHDFFERHYLPAMKRLGIGPIGCFNVVAGIHTPALLVLIDYKSLAEMQSSLERLSSDEGFTNAWKEFETGPVVPYVRYESILMQAFSAHPRVEVPPTDANRPGRLFELRTYEAKDAFASLAKIDMFNQEEIKIFRDCGFAPVFFGQGVVGPRLPNLTYVVGFDDMEAREKAWSTFRVNPDWARIRVKPGWTDAEAVSNIHTSFLRPTAYSEIR